jgi:uncharacterized repeat protein (TIGR01451 family)
MRLTAREEVETMTTTIKSIGRAATIAPPLLAVLALVARQFGQGVIHAESPILSLDKSGTFVDESLDGYAQVGETISYTFTVSNDGDGLLTNVSVTDPLPGLSAIDCLPEANPIVDLVPTESITCTASYAITLADIIAFQKINVAVADSIETLPVMDEEIVTLPSTVVNGCMEEVAGFDLTCRANDVQVANAFNIVETDPCESPNDTVTFDADFEVLLTAQRRHDIGLYFAHDGDPNGDGAFSGMCSVAILPFQPNNEACTAAGTPFACCTGSGAGTCEFVVLRRRTERRHSGHLWRHRRRSQSHHHHGQGLHRDLHRH